jgi:acylphosphatase
MVTKHLIITGRVQGVGYRYYLAYKAQQFNITGWVRNRSDGSVEAVIQGTAENVEALILRAHRGPPKASVSDVTVKETSGEFTAFVTRPTA